MATEIINDKSYTLATMTEIAAALDLRDATLYYYFPNKQALAFACHCRSLETFERLLTETDVAGGSGIERLERFLFGMIKDADRHGAQIYLGDYTYLEPRQRAEIAAWVGRLTTHLETFIKDGIIDGSILPCETELAVQLLVGTLVWLAKWAPTAAGMTTERLTQAIKSFALNGLAKERSR
ncbi:TetR/AcrR family transcriptional regulator [Sphingomonas sp. GB1N7]